MLLCPKRRCFSGENECGCSVVARSASARRQRLTKFQSAQVSLGFYTRSADSEPAVLTTTRWNRHVRPAQPAGKMSKKLPLD